MVIQSSFGNTVIIECKKHGKTIASVYLRSNRKTTYTRCKKCDAERRKSWWNEKYFLKPEYKCAGFSCIFFDRYYQSYCSQCKGKWKKIQKQYLLAFKPQRYQWRWNQI